ncbi:ferredoxin [Nocardia tenerifensis]|uniref:Ferredoxin n=1 Tax=Nocardia tenerifensis TaxID=228006 RepID=A0A318KVH1_9NOCA|nr:ferredoxin [Nocardia tenerifensis]PXX68741.1 ferredoxin [Nocardia tenerifensis]
MRITVDRHRCVGAGMCALLAGAVFDQDADDGKVRLLHPSPPSAERAAARDAERACPSGAIVLVPEGNS